MGLLYVDFNGDVQEGELICNKAIAQDMVEIFYRTGSVKSSKRQLPVPACRDTDAFL